ncbi:hypothetical protein [Salinicoccus sp. HZC-1]|uniref:hypothetical protein n=1 Tax=Salinicoccus sp. HZC-1 TaxID=3385497 RepID=UPI00398A95AB
MSNFDKVLKNSKLMYEEGSYAREMKQCVLYERIQKLIKENWLVLDEDDVILILNKEDEYDEVAVIEYPKILRIIDYTHKKDGGIDGELKITDISLDKIKKETKFSVGSHYSHDLQSFSYRIDEDVYEFKRSSAKNDDNYLNFYSNFIKA